MSAQDWAAFAGTLGFIIYTVAASIGIFLLRRNGLTSIQRSQLLIGFLILLFGGISVIAAVTVPPTQPALPPRTPLQWITVETAVILRGFVIWAAALATVGVLLGLIRRG